MHHRPIAYQRLGEIAEAQSRTADAIEQYSRLLELWRDDDSSLKPLLDEVRGRLQALRASQG